MEGEDGDQEEGRDERQTRPDQVSEQVTSSTGSTSWRNGSPSSSSPPSPPPQRFADMRDRGKEESIYVTFMHEEECPHRGYRVRGHDLLRPFTNEDAKQKM